VVRISNPISSFMARRRKKVTGPTPSDAPATNTTPSARVAPGPRVRGEADPPADAQPFKTSVDLAIKLVDTRPGYAVLVLGMAIIVFALGVEALAETVLEPVEFVASLAAGVTIILFGTTIDVSAQRERGKVTTGLADAEARTLEREPSPR
jgi:hypothetical protein